MDHNKTNRFFLKGVWLIFLFLFTLNGFCIAQDRYTQQRNKMVSSQIQARGISNQKVLRAMRTVPRHLFVLPEHARFAYQDSPLPLTDNQTISQPYVVAFMTEALQLKPTDKVLEIGTGSGYQAAILAEICDSVFTIEIFESLGTRAKNLFEKLEYKNINCTVGDGYKGWPQHSPFDAIIVTCSPTHVPQALKEQLAEDGRMIIPVGPGRVQHLVLLTKKRGKIREKKVLPVRFVPMIDKDNKEY